MIGLAWAVALSSAWAEPAPPAKFAVAIVDDPGEPTITGGMVAAASANLADLGTPSVKVRFTPAGRVALANLTRENVGKRVAIMVDGAAVAVVTVTSEISAGEVEVRGDFTAESARRIAADIRDSRPRR